MRDSSRHGARRAAQRSVPGEHIEFAVDWGYPIDQPLRRVAYHVGAGEIAAALREGVVAPDGVRGLAVVLAEDGAIVTVIRSPDRRRLSRFRRPARWRR